MRDAFSELIYDLIFSDKTEYSIMVHNYIDRLSQYNSFLERIRDILKKSQVFIIREYLDLDKSEKIIWTIKVKK